MLPQFTESWADHLPFGSQRVAKRKPLATPMKSKAEHRSHSCKCMHVYIEMSHACPCVYICVHLCTSVYMCVCIHIYIYIYLSISLSLALSSKGPYHASSALCLCRGVRLRTSEFRDGHQVSAMDRAWFATSSSGCPCFALQTAGSVCS